MGCDIHMSVERLHSTKGWVPVTPPSKRKPVYRADGSRDFAEVDWSDWGRWVEDTESPIKQLADAGLKLVDVIPSEAHGWAFGRDYEAFSELAGVRSGLLAQGGYIHPRGVPEDLSDQVFDRCFVQTARWGTRQVDRGGQSFYWHPDWHTPHWYDLGELKEGLRGGRFTERRIRQLRDEMKKVARRYKLPDHEVRTVFWFDN